MRSMQPSQSIRFKFASPWSALFARHTMGNNEPRDYPLSADTQREGLAETHVTKRNSRKRWTLCSSPEGALWHSNESNDTRSQARNARTPDRSCKNPAVLVDKNCLLTKPSPKNTNESSRPRGPGKCFFVRAEIRTANLYSVVQKETNVRPSWYRFLSLSFFFFFNLHGNTDACNSIWLMNGDPLKLCSNCADNLFIWLHLTYVLSLKLQLIGSRSLHSCCCKCTLTLHKIPFMMILYRSIKLCVQLAKL